MSAEPFGQESVTAEESRDELITMRELCEIAGKEMGSKGALHIATIRTWITKGKQGVVLQTFKQLGVRLTTRGMWEDFKEKVSKEDVKRCEQLREQLRDARERKKGLVGQALKKDVLV